jgi:hypothetical protein
MLNSAVGGSRVRRWFESKRNRTTLIVLLMLSALIRLERSAFTALDARVRELAGHEMIIGFSGGDPSLRDVPKAQKLANGHFFADPWYLGEPHWYPFITPLVAAAVARVTDVPVALAYYEADLLFRGLELVGVLALFACLLGEWGIACFSVCVLFGYLAPQSSCTYPFQTVRAMLFLYFGLAGRFCTALQQRSPLTRSALALGVVNGLLGLWHGASFFVATFVSAGLAIACLVRWVTRSPRAWRPLLATAAAFVGPMVALLSLLLLPQLLHYGHLERAQGGRVYLEAPHRGGSSFTDLVHLSLFARDWQLLPFVAATLHPSTRRRFWPLLAGLLVATLIGHLGFVIHDPTHPRFAKWALDFMPAPPHTFIAVADILSPVVWLLGWGWLAALVGGYALKRLGQEWIASVAAMAALGSLSFHQWPPAVIDMSWGWASEEIFAKSASKALGESTVLLRGHRELLWMANFYPMCVPLADHANHYVQETRWIAESDLQVAVHNNQPEAAEALIRRYRIGGFINDGTYDEVAERCGGPVAIDRAGLQFRPYKGSCRP